LEREVKSKCLEAGPAGDVLVKAALLAYYLAKLG
jgi:hypothetical protein